MKRKALRRGLPSTGGRAGALCVCCANGRVPRRLFRRDLRPRLAARSIAALAVRKTQCAKSSGTAGVEFFLPALKGRAARDARSYAAGFGWQGDGAQGHLAARVRGAALRLPRVRTLRRRDTDCSAARPADGGRAFGAARKGLKRYIFQRLFSFAAGWRRYARRAQDAMR